LACNDEKRLKQAIDYLCENSTDPQLADKSVLKDEASTLVEEYWEAIRSLAQTLRKKTTLSYEEVYQTVAHNLKKIENDKAIKDLQEKGGSSG